MNKEDYKTYANPNCPICKGKGYIEAEDLRHPDDPVKTSIKKEMCECAIRKLRRRLIFDL